MGKNSPKNEKYGYKIGKNAREMQLPALRADVGFFLGSLNTNFVTVLQPVVTGNRL